MSNDDLVDLLTNALGNPNFDPDTVMKALAEKANEMQQRGEHPGSLYAIANSSRRSPTKPNAGTNKEWITTKVVFCNKV